MDHFERMRIILANRQDAKNRGTVALVDLGSTQIVGFVIRLNPLISRDNSNVSALDICNVIGYATTPSKGIKFGEIIDKEKLTDAISLVLLKAQKRAEERVDYVFVSTSGGRPKSLQINGTTEIEDEIVCETDISRSLYSCDIPTLPPGREFLHAHPVNFTVDHQSGLHDPRGMAGNRLSVNLQLLEVDQSHTTDLISVVESCRARVAGIVSSPYMTGLSTLIAAEKDLGAACVDIGSSTTGISVFYQKHMINASVIRTGGNWITADISKAFEIEWDVAEQLKLKHGSVLPTSRYDRYYCQFSTRNNKIGEITRNELIGVIRPRVEEIFEDILLNLEAAGFNSVPGQSIVLTGGCTHLVAIEALARDILGPSVRLGRPIRLRGLPDAMSGPSHSSAVGLCLHAAQPQDEIWDFDLASNQHLRSSIGRTIEWIRKNI